VIIKHLEKLTLIDSTKIIISDKDKNKYNKSDYLTEEKIAYISFIIDNFDYCKNLLDTETLWMNVNIMEIH